MKKYLMWNDHDQQFYADPTIAGSITTKIGDVMGAGQKIIEIDMSKIYAAYDDYNSRIFADHEMGGSVIPNCGCNALRNGWKVLEMDTDKVKINGEVNGKDKDTTGNI